jgi:hypothetical protein
VEGGANVYVKALFGERGEIVAWIDRELTGLPVESVARRWRHEIYFETPFDLAGDEVAVVEKGDVAFWRPGRAFCLFFGYSQPYSPVVRLGAVVGVPDTLASVEEGTPVQLSSYTDFGKEGDVAKALRDAGLKAAAHSWEGEELVGVLVEGAGSRVGVEVSVEDDGFYSQSQPIAFFDNAPPTLAAFKTLAKDLGPTGIRLDVDDEGYIVLTAFSHSFNELVRDLRRLLSTYVYVERTLTSFYAVRRPV